MTKHSNRKQRRNKTPPPSLLQANGVNGFMFTSPNKRTGGLVTAAPAVDSTRKLLFNTKAAPVEAQDDENVLFSPYHCTPKHRYFTRANAKKITVDLEETTKYGEFQVSVKQHMEIELRDLDISDLETEDVLASLAWIQTVNQVERSYEGNVLLEPQSLKDRGRVTLVLDLDETLVHCSIDQSKLPDYELKFTVPFENRVFQVFVQKRPGVIEFLKKASKLFEIVIFTASQKIYADKLLDLLDPTREWTRQRLFRDACVHVENTFVKDLRALGRDLSRVVIVDNAVEAFSFHLDNGVPIKSWFAESDDEELGKLFDFLVPLSQMDDVRPYLSHKFKLKERIGLS